MNYECLSRNIFYAVPKSTDTFVIPSKRIPRFLWDECVEGQSSASNSFLIDKKIPGRFLVRGFFTSCDA